jgi:hypothetical protein
MSEVTNGDTIGIGEKIKAIEDPFPALLDQWQQDEPKRRAAADFLEGLKPGWDTPEGRRLVLSVDGGGSRGYITLHCLAKLEELTHTPCNELFDFCVGTSTGAIISAALSIGFNAHWLLEIYRELISSVFDERRKAPFLTCLAIDIAAALLKMRKYAPYIKLLARNEYKYMYDHAALREALQAIFEDLTFKELYDNSKPPNNDDGRTQRLLVTIKDVRESRTLFATNAGPGARPFENICVAEAVLGSAVAPMFLKPYRFWVDGGVGSYSNPCYEGTVEATEYFTGLVQPRSGPYQPKDDDAEYMHENVTHLSFGTGVLPNEVRGTASVAEAEVGKRNFFNWLIYLVSEAQQDASEDQVRLTEDRFSVGNNAYRTQNGYGQDCYGMKVDFRRYQIVLDPEVLTRPTDDPDYPGPGLGLDIEEGSDDWKCISNMEMNARSEEDLDLMRKIGEAWAEAIGKKFNLPHYPYRGDYTPPGSPKTQPDFDIRMQEMACK